MTYKRIPSTDPRLGRHIEHDPQSKRFPFRAAPDVVLKTVRHRRGIPVLDQGDLGSCTGNTGLGVVGTDPHFSILEHLVVEWNQKGAVTLYSEATIIDEWPGSWPPEDTGSSGLAVAKVLHQRGWISGYRHTFNLPDMKAALQDGPVMLGINWYSSFFYPDAKGNITITPGAYVAGGHEIPVDEIDMEKQRFGFTNSWGESWGVNGRGYISFDLMERLLSEEGDVVVPVPLTQPTPVPDPVVDEDVVPPFLPWWKSLLTLLMKFFGQLFASGHTPSGQPRSPHKP